MAYTSHGFQISGTPSHEGARPAMFRCGGPRLCKRCSEEVVAYWAANPPAPEKKEDMPTSNIHDDFQLKARTIVLGLVKERLEKTDTWVDVKLHDIYVVWFSKTLQNWKALISTNLPDGKYYEVTYDGDKCQTYVDIYIKLENIRVKDEEVAPFTRHNVTIVGNATGVQFGSGNSQENYFG